jgi:hypothetical protein
MIRVTDRDAAVPERTATSARGASCWPATVSGLESISEMDFGQLTRGKYTQWPARRHAILAGQPAGPRR